MIFQSRELTQKCQSIDKSYHLSYLSFAISVTNHVHIVSSKDRPLAFTTFSTSFETFYDRKVKVAFNVSPRQKLGL